MDKSKSIRLRVPLDIWTTLQARRSEGELADALLLPLAVGLFVEGTISLAKAAHLAGMTRYEFALYLKKRGIPAYEYGAPEYEEDRAFIASLQE